MYLCWPGYPLQVPARSPRTGQGRGQARRVWGWDVCLARDRGQPAAHALVDASATYLARAGPRASANTSRRTSRIDSCDVENEGVVAPRRASSPPGDGAMEGSGPVGGWPRRALHTLSTTPVLGAGGKLAHCVWYSPRGSGAAERFDVPASGPSPLQEKTRSLEREEDKPVPRARKTGQGVPGGFLPVICVSAGPGLGRTPANATAVARERRLKQSFRRRLPSDSATDQQSSCCGEVTCRKNGKPGAGERSRRRRGPLLGQGSSY